MLRKSISLIIFLLVCIPAWPGPVFTEFNENTIPLLNEELRKLDLDEQIKSRSAVDLHFKRAQNGATPTATADLVTKEYADSIIGGTAAQEEIEDTAGAMFSGNTETLITATYQDGDGTIDLVVDNDLSNYDNTTSGFSTNTATDGILTWAKAATTAALNTANAYTNSATAAVYTAGQTYTNSATDGVLTYTKSATTAVLASANSYTDTATTYAAEKFIGNTGQATPVSNTLYIKGATPVSVFGYGATMVVSVQKASAGGYPGVASFISSDFDVTSGVVFLENSVPKTIYYDGGGHITPTNNQFTIAGAGGTTTSGTGSVITITSTSSGGSGATASLNDICLNDPITNQSMTLFRGSGMFASSVATDGATVWVLDTVGDRIFKFTSAGTYESNWSLNALNADPVRIDSYDGDIFVIDDTDNAVYQYSNTGTYATNWVLTAANTDPIGISYDAATVWILDSADDAVYKYDTDGTYATNWVLGVLNDDPTAVYFDGTYAWIVEYDTRSIFQYSSTGAIITAYPLELTADNANAAGVDADGSYFYVTDSTDNVIYRYIDNQPDWDYNSVFLQNADADLTVEGQIIAGASGATITTAAGKLDGTQIDDADYGDVTVSGGSWTVDSGGTDYSYVDRGDPASADFTQATLTADGTYHDVDFSGIVPAAATAVALKVLLQDNLTGQEIHIRKNGNSNDQNETNLYTQVANLNVPNDAIVGIGSDGILEIKLTNTTWTVIRVNVKGWWLCD